MSSLIISFCDGSESFLTCSIPDLQLYQFVLKVDDFDLEVDTYLLEKNVTYSGKMVRCEGVISETKKKTSLSNS